MATAVASTALRGWSGSIYVSYTHLDPVAAGYAISFRPVDSTYYPTFSFVRAGNAGNVALTGLDPNVTYAVSIAAINERGLVSGFSVEQFLGCLLYTSGLGIRD